MSIDTTILNQARSLFKKTVLVTGAGRGIGRHTAIACAYAGATVLAVSRTKSDLQSAVVETAEACGSIVPHVHDVTSEAFLEWIAGLDDLDVLVNNAGTNKLQLIEDVDDATLDMLLELNIRTMFKVTRAGVQRLRKGGKGGAIILMSSQMGHVGATKRTVYCMTKHAVEGLMKSLALELAPENIRVNSVAPSIVETSMTAPFFEDEAYRKFALSSIPLGRVGQPDDIAHAVLYLASPAAGFVTGTSLRVDGGATA